MKKFLRTAGTIAVIALMISLLCASAFAATGDYNVSREVNRIGTFSGQNVYGVHLTITPAVSGNVCIKDTVGSGFDLTSIASLFNNPNGQVSGNTISWTASMTKGQPSEFYYYVTASNSSSLSDLNVIQTGSGIYDSTGSRVLYSFTSGTVVTRDVIVADFPELKATEINVMSGSSATINLLDMIDLQARPTGPAYVDSVTTFKFYRAPFHNNGYDVPIAEYRIPYGEMSGQWTTGNNSYTVLDGSDLYITRTVYWSEDNRFATASINYPINVNYCTPALTVTAKDTQAPYGTNVELIPSDIVEDDQNKPTVVWVDPDGNPVTDGEFPDEPVILNIFFNVVGSTNPEETQYLPYTDGTMPNSALTPTFKTGSNDTDFVIGGVTYKLGDKTYTVTPGNGLTVVPAAGEHKVTPKLHDFTIYSDPVDVTYPPAELNPETEEYEPGDEPETTPEFHNGRKIIVKPNGGTWRNNPSDQTLPLTQDITLEDPTRPEYIFVGWTCEEPETGDIRYIFTARWVKVVAKGKATIVKVDSINEEKLLAGAVFELHRVDEVDGKKKDFLIGANYTTDEKGTVSASNLISGSYYWKEIQAPEGYKLSEESYLFEIEKENEVSLKIANAPSIDADDIFSDDHFAYIIGYPDGNVLPQHSITRAEVATIFFRLLDDSVRDTYFTSVNKFSDVNKGQWFNNAISTMARMGIINGYPDGTFKPNNPITRAEFAAIAARFDSVADEASAGFTDIANHWARVEINKAANRGWITGYPDHTFRPNQLITRAEAMTLVNRVTNRNPGVVENLLAEDVMITWPDNKVGAWYYVAVQEATNSHFYNRDDNKIEIWEAIRPARNWAELEY